MMTILTICLSALVLALLWRDFSFRRINDHLTTALIIERQACNNARYLEEIERSEYEKTLRVIKLLESGIQEWAEYARDLEIQLNDVEEAKISNQDTRNMSDEAIGRPTFTDPAKPD